MTNRDQFRAEVRRADKHRKADGKTCVTCPSSRHAQMIAEAVGAGKPYPMLQEEPEHCAVSILSAVGSLYEARLKLAQGVAREQAMWTALKRISMYDSPDKLRRTSEKTYGLEADEAIEYAYENVIQEAKNAIKGMPAPARKVERETERAIRRAAASLSGAAPGGDGGNDAGQA